MKMELRIILSTCVFVMSVFSIVCFSIITVCVNVCMCLFAIAAVRVQISYIRVVSMMDITESITWILSTRRSKNDHSNYYLSLPQDLMVKLVVVD